MNNCKFCNNEVALNKLTSEGLCSKCQPEVTKSIKKHVDIIQDTFKLAETTDNEKTYVGLLSLILKNLKALDENYVSKGINATNFNIKQAIKEIEQEKESLTATKSVVKTK